MSHFYIWFHVCSLKCYTVLCLVFCSPCVCSPYLILFLEFPCSCLYLYLCCLQFCAACSFVPAMGDVISCYTGWGKASE
ncbi:hypothetical protein XELAEV_18003753mg [Xenopus laevis]|nr:hypothetical protein XELAEV_18003753mg [Xenopus laevis]